MKYRREDLAWEAVRRNEYYKQEYSDKVLSRQMGEETTLYSLTARFKLFKLFDPDIDIDQIRKQICEGKDRKDVHPYYHLYSKRKPILQHDVPGLYKDHRKIPSINDFNWSSRNDQMLLLRKAVVADRIVVSIDPTAKEDIIVEEIKSIRKRALQTRRDKYRGLDKNIEDSVNEDGTGLEEGDDNRIISRKSYSPRDIDKYIGHLRMYDRVIAFTKENNVGWKIIQGAVIVDENFSFKCMLPDDYELKKVGNLQRKWRIAYNEAVRLIRMSPDIIYSAHRTK